jgi:hypothetical protein
VVLGPAERLDALAGAGADLVDVLGDRSRADEAQCLHVRVREERVDGLPVALHDVERAGRQPAWRSRSASSSETDGSFSLGLSTKVLPQTSALQNIHIGTMAGKLNGVMPATDAERLADGVHVDAGRRALAVAALEQVRGAGGELDVLQAAGQLALGVGRRLAVLGADQRRDLLAVRVDQFAEPEHDLGPAAERRGAATRVRGARVSTAVRTSAAVAATTSACCSPVAGS